MRTLRQLKIHRAVLDSLTAVPGGYLLPDEILRADAARLVYPAPTTAELDEEIRRADRERRAVGLDTESGMKWKLSDTGRAWLAENP
jgi:hypothetical protein